MSFQREKGYFAVFAMPIMHLNGTSAAFLLSRAGSPPPPAAFFQNAARHAIKSSKFSQYII